MSTHADVAKTRLYLDGDAFRGAAGLAFPTTSLWSPTVTGMDPFGAIRAGMKRNQERESKSHTAWNVKGTYRSGQGSETDTIEFEPLDLSKATTLTLLRGGSITAVDESTNVYEWIEKDDEEFAFLFRAIDPLYGATAWFAPRATLDTTPEETVDGEDLAGYPIKLKCMPPTGGGRAIRKFTSTNLLAPA